MEYIPKLFKKTENTAFNVQAANLGNNGAAKPTFANLLSFILFFKKLFKF